MSQVLSGMVINRGGTWIGEDDAPPRPTLNRREMANDQPLSPPVVNWGEPQQQQAPPCSCSNPDGPLLPPVVNWTPPAAKKTPARHTSRSDDPDLLLPPKMPWD